MKTKTVKNCNSDTAYKDTGIVWIGRVPKDFIFTKIKYLYDISVGKPTSTTSRFVENLNNVLCVSAPDITWRGIDFDALSKSPFTRQDERAFILRQNDIIMREVGTPGIACYVTETYEAMPLYFNSTVLKLSQKERIDFNPAILSRYMYYWSQLVYNSGHIEATYNAGRVYRHLPKRELSDFPICIPSEEKQKHITDYLDKKCDEIDRLLDKIVLEVKSLRDYQDQIIIQILHRSRSADSTKRTKLKYICKPINTKSALECRNLDTLSFSNGNLLLLRDRDSLSISDKADRLLYNHVYPDDIVLNLMGTQYGVKTCLELLSVGTIDLIYLSLRLIRPDISDAKFLSMYLLGKISSEEVFTEIKSPQDILNISVDLPSIEEQKEIAARISDKSDKIDRLIELYSKEQQDLNKYRQAIIYEHLTGKEGKEGNEYSKRKRIGLGTA